MEQANRAIEQGCFAHLRARNRQDVADEHILQMLGLPRGFTHGQNRAGGGDRVGNPDDRFLRNARSPHPQQRENRRTQKRERQADPVGSSTVRVHSHQDGYGGAQCRNLGQGQIHEDDAAFDHVHAQIGVDSRQDQTGQERHEQEGENLHR